MRQPSAARNYRVNFRDRPVIDGAMTGDRFAAYVRQELVPVLRSGARW